ncbi:DNA-directed DNA polymerase III (polc) [Lachnospiraceae bacterium KHCPX20]|nr:DNA-directed DNA polymerase III (polc) [Lachnospiraceae bacterium KHCPX20]
MIITREEVIEICQKEGLNDQFHNHTTDGSINDAVTTPEELARIYKEKGATVVGITDHGSCAGWMDFYTACKNEGIQPALGVECYLRLNGDEKGRNHLVLLAKNYEGYQELCRLVSESNRRLEAGRLGATKFPIVTEDMLQMVATGNVICTSACIAGPVAKPFMMQYAVDHAIQKVLVNRRKYISEENYKRISAQYKENKDHIAALEEQRKEMDQKVKEFSKEIRNLDKTIQTGLKGIGIPITYDKEYPNAYLNQLFSDEELKNGIEKKEIRYADFLKIYKRSSNQYAEAFHDFLKTYQDFVDQKDAYIVSEASKERKEVILQKEEAQKQIEQIKEEIAQIKKKLSEKDEIVGKKPVDIFRKITEYQEKIDNIKALRPTDEQVYEQAKEIASRIKGYFHEDFYMEVQNHGLKKEKRIYVEEAKIAKELGIPLIAANDTHIPTKEDALKREYVRNFIATGNTNLPYQWNEEDAPEYCIKSGVEIAKELLKILPAEDVLSAMRNTKEVARQITLQIDKQHLYPQIEGAEQLIMERINKGKALLYPNGFPVTSDFPGQETYEQRLQKELDVIREKDMFSYFELVARYIDAAKSVDSLNVGPGRGSGAGSLVCYLCGITERIEPMKLSLLFERFLNPHRITMPDIDTDFSKEGRKIAIDSCIETYGEKAIAGIMTKGRVKSKSAIDIARKLYALQQGKDKRFYSTLGESIKKTIPADAKTLTSCNDVLAQAFENNEDAKKIIKIAQTIEGQVKSIGQHAAGKVVLGQGERIENYVPLMGMTDPDNNPIMVIQADMIQAEGMLGFVKMDFLGLKNLDVLKVARDMIKENYGVDLDLYHIQFDKDTFKNIFSKGDTNFVFQFESDGMKKMLQDFKPESFEDLILLVACYRPGPMQFLTGENGSINIIDVKNKRAPLTYMTPELEPILKNTYGAIVYQEQVMEIFQKLAGYSVADADFIRRAMSKKHLDEIQANRKAFIYGDPSRNIKGCKANGIDPKIADKLFTQMEDFAKYAFNKSHAACYAFVSYMTGYLKHKYFKEYICAAMTQQDKPEKMIEDCRNHNVKIYCPNINKSNAQFRTYKDGIMYGFKNVKGLNDVDGILNERNENGPFTSIEDLIKRTTPNAGILKSLFLSGAMDSLLEKGTNRRQALAYALNYTERYKEIKKQEESVKAQRQKYKKTENEKDKLALNTALMGLKLAKIALEDDISYDKKIGYNQTEELTKEAELLGSWISKNPLDGYNVEDYETVNVEAGSHKIAGVVSNVKLLKTKKDNRPMAAFQLVDKNGSRMKCVCFPSQYENIKDKIADGNILIFDGTVKVDTIEREQEAEDENLDAMNIEYHREMIVNDVKKIEAQKEQLLFYVKDLDELYGTLYQGLKQYKNEDEGLTAKVYVEQTGEIMHYDGNKVDKALLDRGFAHGSIIVINENHREEDISLGQPELEELLAIE